MSLVAQLANIGSEVGRAARAKMSGHETRAAAALDRCLELFDLTLADERWHGRRREIARAREVVCDFLVGENDHGSTTESLDAYFLPFAAAARQKLDVARSRTPIAAERQRVAEEPAVYSVVDAAKALDISVPRMRRLIHDEVLPSERRGKRRLLPASGLLAFKDERLRRAAEAIKNAPTDWDWEGNVVAKIAEHLALQGWQIVARADAATREHGVDLKAERAGVTHWIEVKGWPSAVHARGVKKGRPKMWRPTMARSYAGDLLLSCLLLRADHPKDSVSIAVPARETFTTLIRRLRLPLERASIGAYVVHEDGHVEDLIDVPPPIGAFRL